MSKQRARLPKPIEDLRNARKWPKGVPMPKAAPYRSHARWTAEEDDAVREYYLRYGPHYLARLLGRSMSAVFCRVQELNVERRRRRWTKTEDALLKKQYGRMPLTELVQTLGRPRKAVRVRAMELGLTVAPPPWTEEQLEQVRTLYSTVPVAEIARRVGHTSNAVMTRARELGLARRVKPETKALIRLVMKSIGHRPLAAIAIELGISADRVRRIAIANGYDANARWWVRTWTAREDAYLRKHHATSQYREIAQHLGRTPSMVEQRARALELPMKKRHGHDPRQWLPAHDDILKRLHGKRSVEELATQLKRSAAAVKRRMKLLGIVRKRSAVVMVRRRWRDDDIAQLVELARSEYAEEIARRLDRTVDTVLKRATLLGIAIKSMKRKRWTRAEDAVLRAEHQHRSVADIAAVIGRSVEVTGRRMQQLGLVGLSDVPTPTPRKTGQRAATHMAAQQVAAQHETRTSAQPQTAQRTTAQRATAQRATAQRTTVQRTKTQRAKRS